MSDGANTPNLCTDPRAVFVATASTEHGLHGLVFQHVVLCKTRAWLHAHRIDYAHLDSRMRLGQTMHDLSYVRDTSVEGLMGIAPDRLDWKNHIVIEAKGRAGAKEAVSLQTGFYAVVLSVATGKNWRARNDILETRRSRDVIVDDVLLDKLVDATQEILTLRDQARAPLPVRKRICGACSYRFLCGMENPTEEET